jgi:hypothetical protein
MPYLQPDFIRLAGLFLFTCCPLAAGDLPNMELMEAGEGPGTAAEGTFVHSELGSGGIRKRLSNA